MKQFSALQQFAPTFTPEPRDHKYFLQRIMTVFIRPCNFEMWKIFYSKFCVYDTTGATNNELIFIAAIEFHDKYNLIKVKSYSKEK